MLDTKPEVGALKLNIGKIVWLRLTFGDEVNC